METQGESEPAYSPFTRGEWAAIAATILLAVGLIWWVKTHSLEDVPQELGPRVVAGPTDLTRSQGRVGKYLFRQYDTTWSVYRWVISDPVDASVEDIPGSCAYCATTDEATPDLGEWINGVLGLLPAPSRTAEGAGYLVADAGDAEWNGQYNPNGDTCNGEPVYELGVGWVRIGADAAEAALWNDASKHRYSKYGSAYGSGATEGVPEEFSPLSIQYGGLGVPFGNNDYKVVLKCEGHTWGEANIFGQGGAGSGGGTVTISFPYTTAIADDWYTWLAAAGAKTLEAQLIKISDGSTVATDAGGYTMFVPEITINSPAGNVPDVFDAVVEISEWYLPTADKQIDLYATPDGEAEYDMRQGVTDDPTAAMTVVDADIEVMRIVPSSPDNVEPGAFVLTAKLNAAPTLIFGEKALTHVEQYGISITSPAGGATIEEGIRSFAAYLDQGWPDDWTLGSGSIEQLVWYQRIGGDWQDCGSQPIGGSQWHPVHGKVRNSAGWQDWLNTNGIQFHADANKLRVCWMHMDGDWLERCSDEISITVESHDDPPVPPPPEPSPPDPDPDSDPWLEIVFPPDSATVDREFTAYLNYANYHSGTGHLTIITTGAGSYTLYDADVTIAVSGQLIVALDLAAPAPDGVYTLWACLTNPTHAESASDNSNVILVAGGGGSDPPTCEITSPADGATVTGTVLVSVEATDDVSVWAVALYVDGQRIDTLYAPDSAGDYIFTWASDTFANGPHVIMAEVWDSDLQTATDSITVNLVNAQADLERILFTKRLGFAGGAAINDESNNWRDRDIQRVIEVVDWPDAADLPVDPRYRYNVFVGYIIDSDSVDFDDYHLVQPGVSHTTVPTGGRSIKWAMKATPQRTLAYWEIACASSIRLATASNGDPLLLCLTPHSVQRFVRQNSTLEEFCDLSTLGAAPVDMTAVGGKVHVAYADRVLVLDEDTGELDMEIIVPWPDVIDSITALTTDGSSVFIAADLAAGGSRIYQFSYPAVDALADHAHSITALAYLGDTLYVGNDNGDILTATSAGCVLAYATGEASVAGFGLNGSTVYAGTGTDGKLYYKPGSWGAFVDFGWTQVAAIEPLSGYAYAGGTGVGGSYLWYEQAAGAWAQTIGLDAAVAVNDLLCIAESGGHGQLFVATTGIAGTTRLYRVELAPASDYVCGVDPPHLQFKILKD